MGRQFWRPEISGIYCFTICPVILILTAMTDLNMSKYADIGYRYILFEAGHVAQNINLAVLSQGIGSLNLGGFFDQQVADLLGIDTAEEIPLYGIAAGYPSPDTDKNQLRMPAGV
ncbi:MAG: SagB/ThcOx family dehydrogenase [Bacteroidota bacterium]